MRRSYYRKLCLALLLLFAPMHSNERKSSAPYISGDSFRNYSDFIYDETTKKIDPSLIKNGSTIFTRMDELGKFISKVHNHIRSRYILITHNSDFSAPGKYAYLLDDPKLIAWFGQNVENCTHPKMHHLPIGLANAYWPHGNTNTLSYYQNLVGVKERNILLYININLGTNPEKRSKIFQQFTNRPYSYYAELKPFPDYLSDLNNSIFVLSPEGNGLDCHRTWEALLMGAIPIVKTSSLDPMFENLPVLIVNDWGEVDLPLLEAKYLEMKGKTYDNSKMHLNYWLKLIDSYKKIK